MKLLDQNNDQVEVKKQKKKSKKKLHDIGPSYDFWWE